MKRVFAGIVSVFGLLLIVTGSTYLSHPEEISFLDRLIKTSLIIGAIFVGIAILLGLISLLVYALHGKEDDPGF